MQFQRDGGALVLNCEGEGRVCPDYALSGARSPADEDGCVRWRRTRTRKALQAAA